MLHSHGIEVKTLREEVKQKKMTDIFFSKKGNNTPSASAPLTKIPDDRFILNRRFALWLCKDLLSFKTIENKGFADFWLSLGIDSKLPSRKTVSVSGLDDIYKCLKNELMIKLSGENTGMYRSKCFSDAILFNMQIEIPLL